MSYVRIKSDVSFGRHPTPPPAGLVPCVSVSVSVSSHSVAEFNFTIMQSETKESCANWLSIETFLRNQGEKRNQIPQFPHSTRTMPLTSQTHLNTLNSAKAQKMRNRNGDCTMTKTSTPQLKQITLKGQISKKAGAFKFTKGNKKREQTAEFSKMLGALDDMNSIEDDLNFEQLSTPKEFHSNLPPMLSINRIYCSRTGQPIGERTKGQMDLLTELYGDKSGLMKLSALFGKNIAAHWTKTDGPSLNALMKHDPLGYFIYCAALACEPNAKGYSNKSWNSLEAFLNFEIDKCVAYDRLRKIPYASIAACNEIWRDFLTSIDTRHLPTFKFTISELISDQMINRLPQIMRNCVEQHYNAQVSFKLAVTKQDVDLTKLKRQFKGHGNIGNQHVKAYEEILASLKTISAINFTMITEKETKAAKNARYEGQTKTNYKSAGFKIKLKKS